MFFFCCFFWGRCAHVSATSSFLWVEVDSSCHSVISTPFALELSANKIRAFLISFSLVCQSLPSGGAERNISSLCVVVQKQIDASVEQRLLWQQLMWDHELPPQNCCCSNSSCCFVGSVHCQPVWTSWKDTCILRQNMHKILWFGWLNCLYLLSKARFSLSHLGRRLVAVQDEILCCFSGPVPIWGLASRVLPASETLISLQIGLCNVAGTYCQEKLFKDI